MAIGASDGGARPRGAAGAARRRSPAAALVALGIFVTRLFGLARSRAQATYLGTSDVADALTAALRIPNLLQNLFGEGVLSASFIPVYARLLAEGDEAKANRVAGAVLGLLAAVVACLVALGVLAAPLLVDTITPGFEGAKRDLTVTLVGSSSPAPGSSSCRPGASGSSTAPPLPALVPRAGGVERRHHRRAGVGRRPAAAARPRRPSWWRGGPSWGACCSCSCRCPRYSA
jgi:hypothetical protein